MLPISHLFVLVVQIKVLPAEHNCPTNKLRESKMTTQGWVADRLSEWVRKNSNSGGSLPLSLSLPRSLPPSPPPSPSLPLGGWVSAASVQVDVLI